MAETNINNNNNKKSLFLKIRRKLILNKIYINLQKYNTLSLIKYNKNYQNKLNKDLNDYKEFGK